MNEGHITPYSINTISEFRIFHVLNISINVFLAM